MKTNLAFILEPPEMLETAALNATALDELLRFGAAKRGGRKLARSARGRVLVSFQDNGSSLFRPFRIY